MKGIVYPEDVQCVYEEAVGVDTKGRIFIGNLEAAQNKQTLRSTNSDDLGLGVRAVVSAAKGAFLEHS